MLQWFHIHRVSLRSQMLLGQFDSEITLRYAYKEWCNRLTPIHTHSRAHSRSLLTPDVTSTGITSLQAGYTKVWHLQLLALNLCFAVTDLRPERSRRRHADLGGVAPERAGRNQVSSRGRVEAAGAIEIRRECAARQFRNRFPRFPVSSSLAPSVLG